MALMNPQSVQVHIQGTCSNGFSASDPNPGEAAVIEGAYDKNFKDKWVPHQTVCEPVTGMRMKKYSAKVILV